jgi:hypothetical protein
MSYLQNFFFVNFLGEILKQSRWRPILFLSQNSIERKISFKKIEMRKFAKFERKLFFKNFSKFEFSTTKTRNLDFGIFCRMTL